MDNKKNIIHSIDNVYFKDGHLKVDGWAFGEDYPIISMTVQFEEKFKTEHSFVINYLNSSDVVSHFGEKATKSRFSIGIKIENLKDLVIVTKAKIVFGFYDNSIESIRIFSDKVSQFIGQKNFSVGVSVTTYNRSKLLIENLNKIKENSFFDIDLIISDDGSVDETKDLLKDLGGIYWASSENKGVAWNKNRALFFSNEILSNSLTLLMEDDVFPTKFGWDIDWVLSSALYGHINFDPPWFGPASEGMGQWNQPYKSGYLSGQCSGFTKEVLAYVGYLDSRFGRYGHEHVEHTMRMIRAGYGGEIIKENSPECVFYSISGNIEVSPSESSFQQEDVDRNGEVLSQIWNESIYRAPWRNDDEMRIFRKEIQGFVKNQ